MAEFMCRPQLHQRDGERRLLLDIDESKDSNSVAPTLYLYRGQRACASPTTSAGLPLGVANGAQAVVVELQFAADAAATSELADVTRAATRHAARHALQRHARVRVRAVGRQRTQRVRIARLAAQRLPAVGRHQGRHRGDRHKSRTCPTRSSLPHEWRRSSCSRCQTAHVAAPSEHHRRVLLGWLRERLADSKKKMPSDFFLFNVLHGVYFRAAAPTSSSSSSASASTSQVSARCVCAALATCDRRRCCVVVACARAGSHQSDWMEALD
jgi:hypothetical protein